MGACHDAKDNKYLELAVAATGDVIISSDEDLLVLNPWAPSASFDHGISLELLDSRGGLPRRGGGQRQGFVEIQERISVGKGGGFFACEQRSVSCWPPTSSIAHAISVSPERWAGRTLRVGAVRDRRRVRPRRYRNRAVHRAAQALDHMADFKKSEATCKLQDLPLLARSATK
jgi:hypothetical protein